VHYSQVAQKYIQQYAFLHEEKKAYGTSSEQQLGYIQRTVCGFEDIDTILDYGCGRSRLVDWLAKLHEATPFRFDPAIAEFAARPNRRFDLVLNTDVLEHIPESDISAVLADIAHFSSRAFFNISVVEAVQILPNGENAHCTVRPKEWWSKELQKHYSKIREVKSYRHTTVSFVTW